VHREAFVSQNLTDREFLNEVTNFSPEKKNGMVVTLHMEK
jgi:hypothetical protein